MRSTRAPEALASAASVPLGRSSADRGAPGEVTSELDSQAAEAQARKSPAVRMRGGSMGTSGEGNSRGNMVMAVVI